MMEEYIAYGILVIIYIFGGAAFFHSNQTSYKNVLAGWAAFNAFVILVIVACMAAWWAILVVIA